MTPEQQAQLFEPFNRLGAEQSGIDGTGIGLVIVQRLVALMNGRLIVQSQRGVGSVFTVSLPAAEAAEASSFAALDEEIVPASEATIVYAEEQRGQCAAREPDSGLASVLAPEGGLQWQGGVGADSGRSP